MSQSLLRSVSPSHGRILIYVWAVQQDGSSKRAIPENVSQHAESSNHRGRDALVPWVLSENAKKSSLAADQKVFNRYYHFFEAGELSELASEAAEVMNLAVGPCPSVTSGANARRKGVEIVHDGWEKSNFYLELRLWEA